MTVMSRDRAEEALWAGLRLAVVDVETTWQRDAGTKVVSIAVVTCRSGRQQGRWSSYVNPGPDVSISAKSTQIHGLRDEDVAGAPLFADIAGTVLSALEPLPGETLVVVAHNTAYDIPIIRGELTAAGATMPEAPVLDTMGQLQVLAGVSPGGKGLTDLLGALGIVNDNPHDALADATATARAACELLGRAAAQGHTDIDEILTLVNATTTTAQTAARGRGRSTEVLAAPALTGEHLKTHTTVLPADPATRTVERWTRALTDCGRLRCSHAADRISTTTAPASVVLPALREALSRVSADRDWPAVATLLDAAGPALEGAGLGLPGRNARAAALRTYDDWSQLLDGAERCGRDRCPACRDERPCGVDTWTYHLAGAALDAWTRNTVHGFLPFTGERSRTGVSVWATWAAAGRLPLAEVTLWRCHEWWTDHQHPSSAALLAQTAWNAGSRHPRIADAYINQIVTGGRTADLKTALDVADEVLKVDPQGGPPEHWRALRQRRTWLAGKLAQGTVRYTGQLDADGNPIPVRRHHPTTPKRARPTRFLRTLPDMTETPEDTDTDASANTS